MRQLLFIGIMSTILTPLASFGSDDPFAGFHRVSNQVRRVEALNLVWSTAEKNYSRLENLISQRIAELVN
jgi:hypothetical protein